MRIICNKCGRKMEICELIPHLAMYFTQKLAAYVAPFLTMALEHYWSEPKKSWLDDSMASLANISETECPVCKQKACWNPDPEIEEVQKQTTEKKLTIEP